MTTTTLNEASTGTDHSRIAIVGTGFAGLGMAIRLKQQGFDDFVVFERADDVGGTWRDNSYPGCACDVPSHLYSFSFAPNPNWSRTFSTQPEIWEYLRGCARDFGVLPHIRFGHALTDATWDDEAQRWRIETSAGSFTADSLVAGVGPLSEPRLPDIPGIGSFAGAAFHSAQWDHDHDLTGERVAVIGTGASTIQIVPKIQPQVAQLKLFQRTPPWVMPHPDRPLTRVERAIYRAVPGAQRLMRTGIFWARETFVLAFTHPPLMGIGERIARQHLRRQVPDRALRSKLRPRYRMGCKRVLLSNDYYPSLAKPNTQVVTDGVVEIRERSILTADGTEHEVDTIIFGTGFHVTDMPAADHLRGRDGTLMADVWQGSPSAHLGTTVAGFPNLFLLLGPNTGLGHNSVVVMIESQIAYVLDCLKAMDRHELASVEVRAERQAAFNREIDDQMRGTVWTTGGCASWYLDAAGRNSTLWPGASWRFQRRTRSFDLAAYDVRTRTARPEPVAA